MKVSKQEKRQEKGFRQRASPPLEQGAHKEREVAQKSHTNHTQITHTQSRNGKSASSTL